MRLVGALVLSKLGFWSGTIASALLVESTPKSRRSAASQSARSQ